MKTIPIFLVVLLLIATAGAQSQAAQAPGQQPSPNAPAPDASVIAGMYTFLREGEFIQVDVEEGNYVTGYISRYADEKNDKAGFVDHFFKKASASPLMTGWQLKFETRTVKGVWYAFDGDVRTGGGGKAPKDEGFWVMGGKLTIHKVAADGKDSAETRQVEFKSFAPDAE
jgi:hypothetical protein